MPSAHVKARLAEEVALWQADGLVTPAAAAELQERYDTEGFGIGTFVKYVSIGGGVLSLFGLLGAVTALAGSETLAMLLMGATTYACVYIGERLECDPLGRYAISAKIPIALAAVSLGLTAGLLLHLAGVDIDHVVPYGGFLWLPAAFVFAYTRGNTFGLVVAVLGLFHWAGSWTEMVGRSGYSIWIGDPRTIALIAAGVAAIGIWHEQQQPHRSDRFAHSYQALGFGYLNLSLLVLSLRDGGVGWALAGAAVAVAQVALGARLHSGLVTGIGVTAFAIHLFTRYFERFWDTLHMGLFFLAGGAVLLLASVAAERWAGGRSTSPADTLGARKHRSLQAEFDALQQVGLLAPAQRQVLRERYPTTPWSALALARWYSILGAVTAGAGLLLLARDAMDEQLLVELSLAGASGGLWWTADLLITRKQRPRVGAALQLVAAMALQGLTFALAIRFSTGSGNWPAVVGLDAAMLLGLAYLTGNRLLLIDACVCLYLWFGGSTGYASGWGMYWLGMTYPLRFLPVGLLSLAFARAHAEWGGRHQGFTRVYAHFGLLITHLSLWFLSLFGVYQEHVSWGDTEGQRVIFSMLWAATSGGCLYLARRTGLGMLRGYAMTFLVINVYTFYFQFVVFNSAEAWFIHLLLSGGSLVWLGTNLERHRRGQRASEQGA